MALTDQDIRLMASQVLADVPEGGGRMTGAEVVDGVSNNLFSDVSELDRTIGRVSLRKAYPAVLSANRDTYYGVNVIMDQRPSDANVDVTMFTTHDWDDTRSAAVSRMESYLARGPKYDGWLWDQHIAGQKAIVLLQHTDRELPPVGATLVLVKDAGKTTEKAQFVRITKVSGANRSFTSSGCNAAFTLTVVTCEISDPLQVDMLGGIPHCNDDTAVVNANTRVYASVVADAARYAGMTTLADAATLGDYSIKARTIFGQLVPSAQVESAITDAKPNGDSAIPVAAGGTVTITTTVDWDSTHALYVGQGIFPGSLSVTIGSAVVTDKAGLLYAAGVQVGTVDYANGILSIVSGGPDYGTGSKTVSFTPAAMPVRNMQTAGWDVAAESRSGTVVFILDPVPAPGSLSISYMAQGKWYVLRDDGSGALRGADSAYGSGIVNFVTGSVVVTLGALPDVGSTVLATWGKPSIEINRSGAPLAASMRLTVAVPPDAQGHPQGMGVGSVTITWPKGNGTTYTATDDAHGNLTGDATGRINYALCTIDFTPHALPPVGAEITVQAAPASPSSESPAGTLQADQIAFTMAAPPKPGSVYITAQAGYQRNNCLTGGTDTLTAAIQLGDDGLGSIKPYGVNAFPVGSVNYTTGEVLIDRSMTVTGVAMSCFISGPTGLMSA